MYLSGIKQIGRTITFSGAMSNDGGDGQNGGYIPKWRWDFDYKNGTFTDDAVTTSYLLSHIYEQPGTYIVALYYTDNDNQMGNLYTFSITIGDGGIAVFEMQPKTISQTSYLLTREVPIIPINFVNSITYTDEKGFIDVYSSSGWTAAGEVVFGTLIDAEPVIGMGSSSSIERLAGPDDFICRVDFRPSYYVGTSVSVLAVEMNGTDIAVKYNPSTRKLQLYVGAILNHTYNLTLPAEQWCTIEFEVSRNLTYGVCNAWVYARGETRIYTDLGGTAGTVPSGTQYKVKSSMNSPYGDYYLANFYVGSFAQTVNYTDGLGRMLQSQARDGEKDIVSAVDYETNTGRQNKTYRPYSDYTGHMYDASYVSHVNSAYPLTTNPYALVEYYADPLGRVQYTKPAGSVNVYEYVEARSGTFPAVNPEFYYTETLQHTGKISTNRTVSRQYTDKLGRVVKTETYEDGSAEKITSSAVYNMQGAVTNSTPPVGPQSTNQYDFLGRKIEEYTPDAGDVRYLYDDAGRLRFMMDAEGESKTPDNVLYWKYDVLGRVIEKGYSSNYWSNFESQVNNQTYPYAPDTWRKMYVYDGNGVMLFTKGRVVSVQTNNDNDSWPEVTEKFEYDENGNILSVQTNTTDFDLNTYSTIYNYDHLGRVINVQYPSKPTDAVVQNMTIVSPNVYTLSSIATLTAGPSFTVNSGATATLQANNSVRLVPGFRASSGSQFRASINTVITDLMVVTYTYNQLGLLTAIGNGAVPDYYAAYTYNADGSINQEKLNNSSSVKTFSYAHRMGFLTGTSHPDFNESFSHTFTIPNQAQFQNASISSVYYSYGGSSGAPAPYSYTFGYDQFNRMTGADNSIGTANDFTVSLYDNNGKVITRNVGGTAQTLNYYSPTNRLKNVNTGTNDLMYDNNGNMIGNTYRSMSLVYDPFTMMTSSITTGATTDNFQYAGNKERILKTTTVSGVTSSTMYLRGMNDYPLTEKVGTSTGASDRFYIYGPTGLVAMQSGTATYFVVKDHLGSTRVILNSSNSPQGWMDYTPYGGTWRAVMAPVINYRFTGQEFDTEIGLHNFRARMYDDNLWLFYAIDPAHQTHSPYGYAGSNPVLYIDKDGMYFGWDDAAAMIIGGVWNVWSHRDNIHGNFFTALAYFGVGAAQGELMLYPGAGWAASGLLQGVNALLDGKRGLDIGIEAGMGLISSMASGYVGGAVSNLATKYIGNVVIQGLNISGPLVKGLVGGYIGGFASGFVTGFGMDYLFHGDFGQALNAGLSNGNSSGIMGSISGGANGIKYALSNDVNLFTGIKNNNVTVGTGMNRVGDFVNATGANKIKWPSGLNAYTNTGATTPAGMQFNLRWTLENMSKNATFYDLGPRSDGYSSSYYRLAEIRPLFDASYTKIINVDSFNFSRLKIFYFK